MNIKFSSGSESFIASNFWGERKPRRQKIVVLVFFLPLFFSVFRYIPGFEWTLEVAILATLICAISTWRWISNSFNIYIILVAFGIPIWGALNAALVFGQPFWLGLVAQRAYLLSLFALTIIRLISTRRVTMIEVKQSFVALAWINLAFCAPVVLFLDPNQYNDVGALVSNGGGVYNQFNLPLMFILFGAFYYAGLWFRTNQAKYIAVALPFYLYIFGGNSGRILNISVVLMFITLAFIGSSRQRLLRNLTKTIGLIAGVTILAAVLAPDKVNTMATKYADAFSAITGENTVDDPSANARILQTAIALPLIESNLIAGTGSISNQWNDGYKRLFGYFHPTDLGVLGITFVYGIIGLFFFWIQYIFAWRYSRKLASAINSHQDVDFLLAILGCLGFLLVSSITTGSFAFYPEQSLFFLATLYAGTTNRSTQMRSITRTKSAQIGIQRHA